MAGGRAVVLLAVGMAIIAVAAIITFISELFSSWSSATPSPASLAASSPAQRRRGKAGRKSSEVGPTPGFPVPPDTRPPGCDAASGDDVKERLTVSIVIPYLNEEWEYMRGTVQSVLYFTPDRLIKQIVFVSDGNRNPRAEELEAMSPKLKVLVLAKRHGLIRAKMRGMEMVTAPVVVFLEPHCIVNRRWLEPLLDRIAEYPRGLAMPVLDAIPQDNFHEYQRAAVGHFRLEWNFNLIYTAPAGLEDSTKAYPSPATSGGIFAMTADWFRHLELFDVGMRQWGGDHVELTMKAWRCGGRIDIVPCSRVGHMFRDSSHQPYSVKVRQIVRNYARLANVWADRHIDSFLKVKPEAKSMGTGDLRHLHGQRERLKCKNMDWYLKHVDFELGWEVSRICIPGADRSQGGCRGKAVVGRSTIDQLMPVADYLKARERSSLDDAGAGPAEVRKLAPPSDAPQGPSPRERSAEVRPAPEAETTTRSEATTTASTPSPPRGPPRGPPAMVPGDSRWEAATIVGADEEEEL